MTTQRRTLHQIGFAIALAGVLMLGLPAQSAGQGLLTGTITSPSGAPIEGVAVSAQVAGHPMTTSVYTGADGRYFFPAMDDNEYRVWAQAIGLERAEATADVGSGTVNVDFQMAETTDIVRQLSGYQILAALPEDTAENRRGKALFQKNCTYCHQTSTALRDRFDQHGWNMIVSVMLNGFSPNNEGALSEQQQELANYLTKMRGPGPSPMNPQVFRPTGEATLPVVYEYDVEYDGGGYSAHNGSDWRFGPASSAGGTGAMHDSAIDFEGNVWFTSTRGSTERTVARVDAVTGETTSYGVPLGNGEMARAHGIFPAPDGRRIYFNASPRIAWLDGTLGIIDPEAVDMVDKPVLESIEAPAGVSGWLGIDGRGKIWAASGTMQAGGALRFDPDTQEFMHFESPTGGLTYGIAGDRLGNGWWMAVNDDIIVHGNPDTGEITEIPLPEQPLTEYLQPGDLADGEHFGHPGLGGDQSPRRPYADLNGDYLWVPNFFGNTIVRIDINTKELKYFALPFAGMNPYEAMVDSQSRLWVTFQNSDEMGRFDPDTETWTMYSYPTKGMAQRHNHMLEADGVLQFASASGASHRVGRMVIRSEADVQALRQQASGN